jgi:creatinine amidohydrolase/Fe(II)-dependent formamide hydrolase-like protein
MALVFQRKRGDPVRQSTTATGWRWAMAGLVALFHACALAQTSVYLEELTWTEVRDRLGAGTTTIIMPTGGTEQNGPHMVLGRHNLIVRHAAGEIARRLGNTLVAPVLPYVPEGGIEPPTGHMWAPGTITLPDEQFGSVVEYAARSFKVHGFLDIVLLGDSGGNHPALHAVAERLNREWAGTPVRVHHVSDYRGNTGFVEWLRQQGEKPADIGTHAGLSDTSILIAVAPEAVRKENLALSRSGEGSGVNGNPTRATAAYGRVGLEMAIDTAVRQIKALRVSNRMPRTNP